ncbi:hypothetical protein PTKIN_Ptkin12aG0075000 [Pterospermum kingtungense]
MLASSPVCQEQPKEKIFSIALNDPDSFNVAIEGCKGVFHVATPLDFGAKKSKEVLTKSIATVVYNGKDLETMDENFWTNTDFARQNVELYLRSYTISKTLTKRATLEFEAEHRLDVGTVIPPSVVAPFIYPKFPGLMHFVCS